MIALLVPTIAPTLITPTLIAPNVIAPTLNAPHLIAPHLIAWTPFIDPIDAHEWWFLLLAPLAFMISVAYKAVRAPTMTRYWREVAVMTVQIIAAMILLGIASYVMLQIIVPVIAPMPG